LADGGGCSEDNRTFRFDSRFRNELFERIGSYRKWRRHDRLICLYARSSLPQNMKLRTTNFDEATSAFPLVATSQTAPRPFPNIVPTFYTNNLHIHVSTNPIPLPRPTPRTPHQNPSSHPEPPHAYSPLFPLRHLPTRPPPGVLPNTHRSPIPLFHQQHIYPNAAPTQ